jgi:negative regulator of flagellin synthesis FlgM
MEIKNSLLKNLDPYRTRFGAKGEGSGSRAKGTEEQFSAAQRDRVSLSPNARLHTAAHVEALKAPEVRLENVDVLKERVASGDYAIDSRKIAEKLVENEMLLASSLAAE